MGSLLQYQQTEYSGADEKDKVYTYSFLDISGIMFDNQ
jgi:hypothetical protein